ncbi:rhomboid family intramembrane serine protease [Pedococcus sp. NPDC057267]|uniref:rhomboid family intramembrane serine protease n=1 Tax=Pedococcus sp. NPDC057267 TaxID=3346077 RepID=UPI0036395354
MTEPPTPGASSQQEAPPVCPRHPDRVSYVRCQRCQRPVCPECQRPAAVGVQCVDCVREQARTVRSARTVLGGRPNAAPVVSYAIVGLCVLVYVLQLAIPGLTRDIAFVPALGRTEPWRFLTSAFAHSPSQITHILFNMLALWVVGAQYLERLLGGVRYAAVYLVSAIGGGVCYLLLSTPPQVVGGQLVGGTNWFTAAVGASGAVFGLFGALVVVNRKLGLSNGGIWATIGINAVIGFVVPGIAWQAHLGGLLTGAACAAVLVGFNGRESRRYQWPALVGVLALLVVLAVAKYALTSDPTQVFLGG